MTHDIDLDGVFPAMVTPLEADDSIDFDGVRAEAQRLERAGVDGLVPVGTTGESATLSHDEHVSVVETVVDAVSIPVIAGAGSNATHEALALAERTRDAGADALLLISPYYNKPEPAGMEEHYRTIADAVDLPQIVYNVPGRTGRTIAIDTAAALAEHENVVGFKSASGDLGRLSELVERTHEAEFAVLSGEDGLTLPALAAGGRGTISVAANVEPERVGEMVHAALDGDFERARERHLELGPLFRALFWETNPIPLKEALSIRGHVSPRMRSPLSRLSSDRRDALESVLADLDGADRLLEAGR
ncbi:4-hydroxy-tetrahydrodipicolinate synthase [Halococcus thailandensis]|uniref:4-hydroxy-tetrahydrodipicolinate synthase n=1 Tax=Halococcus thailandensis JCM 13552 TaxID=1227457 RepID=M0MZ41_9EURY|nr:4-hydroxy-tetrahydrodipicolinate synthase [Halococcus thailandensis]EMA49680.1 dihydrodipicolinate synthase [Halococcus thailandensis JCM 13552]